MAAATGGGRSRLWPVQAVVERLAQEIRRLQGGLHGKGGLQGVDFCVLEAVILLEKPPFERFVCPFRRRVPAQVLPELVQAVVEQLPHVEPVEDRRRLGKTGGGHG